MKSTEVQPSFRMVMIYRVLMGLVFVLALSLIGGTIYVVFLRGNPGEGGVVSVVGSKSEPTLSPDGQDGVFPDSPANAGQALSPQSLSKTPEIDSIFTGIGRIRASTALPESATVILSIAFPYASGDTAFSGELASRIADFRSVATAYFGSYTAGELRDKDDAAIKAELLGQFNGMLRLGQIGILYFNDYIIIE
ncbi:hypothetical protein AGMMS49991_01330 [Spirochaetia bacterium]|nr:hypothetical protein AGMMS49991_01330 [Spirochaetia bacterium]